MKSDWTIRYAWKSQWEFLRIWLILMCILIGVLYWCQIIFGWERKITPIDFHIVFVILYFLLREGERIKFETRINHMCLDISKATYWKDTE